MLERIYTVKDIAALIESKYTVIGDGNRSFSEVSTIDSGIKDSLSFCTKHGNEGLDLLKKTNASVIMCPNDLLIDENINKTYILVENPRFWFIKTLKAFLLQEKQIGIHPTVIIGNNCQIEKGVFIDAYTVIGDYVTIKKGTSISSNVRVQCKVIIGKNVNIQSGCELGYSGMGYERNNDGSFESFPQIGGIIIGDDVDIGSGSRIGRGTLGNTTIGKGTKIGHNVTVGHNVRIGKNCQIINFCCIQGSVEIGDNSWLAAHSCIRDQIKIGKNAVIGMGAVVTKDVEDHKTVVGLPAKPMEYLDNEIHPSFVHGENLKLGRHIIIEEGCEVGDNVSIGNFVLLNKNTKIGSNVKIDHYVRSSGHNWIGNNVTLRYGSTIAREVTIEDNVFLSPNVMTIYLTHKGEKKGGTTIREGAFIGTNAVLGANVEIGKGVVIGAMSLVTKDCLEPGIYIGIPARKREK